MRTSIGYESKHLMWMLAGFRHKLPWTTLRVYLCSCYFLLKDQQEKRETGQKYFCNKLLEHGQVFCSYDAQGVFILVVAVLLG